MTGNNLTALQAAAAEYLAAGYAVLPGFSPAMIATPDQLDRIRSSDHPAARLCCRLLKKLCKQPLSYRFIVFPITQRQRAERIFGRFREANLLISLGRRSNLLVLDLDHLDKPAANHAAGDYRYATCSVVTGRGRHFYFRYPADFSCTRRITAEGVYLLGDLGWVVASPSEHGCGERYDWLNTAHPVAPLPEELRQSRKALISHRWVIAAVDLVRTTFRAWVLFPLLRLAVPLAARLIEKNNPT